jgi:hypothetical protein
MSDTSSKETDEKDYWTEEDLRNFSQASSKYAERAKTPVELLAAIASLPIKGETDKFSGRDHDKILYGKK